MGNNANSKTPNILVIQADQMTPSILSAYGNKLAKTPHIDALAENGVTEVLCCVTHPILSGNAPKLMVESNFSEIVVSDTIPVPEEKRNGKIKVLSVAPLLGEAIFRIHKGLSVGEMFN